MGQIREAFKAWCMAHPHRSTLRAWMDAVTDRLEPKEQDKPDKPDVIDRMLGHMEQWPDMLTDPRGIDTLTYGAAAASIRALRQRVRELEKTD